MSDKKVKFYVEVKFDAEKFRQLIKYTPIEELTEKKIRKFSDQCVTLGRTFARPIENTKVIE